MYDLIIIGAGASGLISSISAKLQNSNSKILVIEKNETIGKKILITGKGRCNLTTSNTNIQEFIQKFGKNGRFLYSAINQFSIQDTIEFFNDFLKISTKIERGNRVFPVSDSAKEITNSLYSKAKELNVEFKLNTKAKNFVVKNKKISSVLTSNGEFFAKNFILTTGGKSFPGTGSTGDGYYMLEKIGHTINKTYPALVPIICKEEFIKYLEGLSLKNVEIKIDKLELFGEAIFTKNGLSGPIVLDISSEITDNLQKPKKLTIDFKPALDIQKLDQRILRDFEEMKNKKFKNCLDKLLPQKLIPIIIKLSNIDENKPCNLITKQERLNLVNLIKNFEFNVIAVDGFDKAIITKGGVDLTEIEPKTMQSKVIENLYLAGEILDLDGSTGGYNLQVAWTTGFVAGKLGKFNT